MHIPRPLFLLLLCAAVAQANPRDPLAQFPPAYQDAMKEAITAFHDRDYGTAIKVLDRADLLLAPTPLSLNTRGAVAIERKDFVEGERLCRAALQQDAKFFPARFNLGEIPFVKGDYAEARRIYQEILDEDERNELVGYRIFLTHLMEKDYETAKRLLDAMRFPSDTAAYYYAHAAWDFAHAREEKARGWIRSGDWVFPRTRNLYFADVLYDLGWMKREP